MVELEKQDEQVGLRIRDYGKGFHTNGEPIENKLVGVGIAGMREPL